MERLRIVLFVVLACVAPVMATDYVIENYTSSGADISTVTWSSYVYDGSVDPSQWIADTGYGTTYSTFMYSPYLTNLTSITGMPALTSADNISFAHLTTNTVRINTGSDLNVNRVNYADNYFPLSYSTNNPPTYSYNAFQQKGGNLTCNEFVIGSDIKPFSDNSLRNGEGLANYGLWVIRDGNFSAGQLRVANTCTTLNSMGAIPTPTFSEITTERSTVNTQQINIGDISLNDSWVALTMTAGDWTISGDITQHGNMVAMLLGTRNAGGERIGDSELIIKPSTLMDMISSGYLFTASGNAYTRFRPGAQYDLRNPTAYADVHAVTLANMYSELDIQDLGDGTVSVMLIPEPATMVLLGLGALVLRRKK